MAGSTCRASAASAGPGRVAGAQAAAPPIELPLFGAISDKSRSRMGRRLVLRRQTTTVYAGEVFEIAPYYGMDEDLLRRSFSLIQGTWNNS